MADVTEVTDEKEKRQLVDFNEFLNQLIDYKISGSDKHNSVSLQLPSGARVDYASSDLPMEQIANWAHWSLDKLTNQNSKPKEVPGIS